MKEEMHADHLAIAWQYPGQALEVIPARYSMITRPTPATNITSAPFDMVDEQPVDANASGVLPVQLLCKLFPCTMLARLILFSQR